MFAAVYFAAVAYLVGWAIWHVLTTNPKAHRKENTR
jgi:hypothetical protein